MGDSKMKKLALAALALALIVPSSLFAQSASPWFIEVEQSSEGELFTNAYWQYSFRFGRRILHTTNGRFSVSTGITYNPEPLQWWEQHLSYPGDEAGYPLWAAGMFITNSYNFRKNISLALEPRFVIERADWSRSWCEGGGDPCDPELGGIIRTTGSGWSFVTGIYAIFKIKLPLHMIIGTVLGYETDVYSVNLGAGRDDMWRTGFLYGVQF